MSPLAEASSAQARPRPAALALHHPRTNAPLPAVSSHVANCSSAAIFSNHALTFFSFARLRTLARFVESQNAKWIVLFV